MTKKTIKAPMIRVSQVVVCTRARAHAAAAASRGATSACANRGRACAPPALPRNILHLLFAPRQPGPPPPPRGARRGRAPRRSPRGNPMISGAAPESSTSPSLGAWSSGAWPRRPAGPAPTIGPRTQHNPLARCKDEAGTKNWSRGTSWLAVVCGWLQLFCHAPAPI